MIYPSQAVRIVIATKPVDFRKGHDGLAALAERELGLDPHSGIIVVFRAKRGDRIKVLLWDGSGLVLCYKRLEQGKFAWPKVQDGVMRLSKGESQEMILDAFNRALAFYGGVPRRVIIDNPKTMVLFLGRGKERIFHPRFLACMSHYAMEPVACTPASGWEKGQVENQVKILRKQLFAPKLTFDTLADLNAHLEARCEDLSSKLHPEAKTRSIRDVFAEEQVKLRPVGQVFDGYAERQVRVTGTCLVQYDTNTYSVPCQYACQTLSLRAYADRVVLSDGQNMIAEHARCFGRYKKQFCIWHYLPLFQQRPGALRNGAPFKRWEAPKALTVIWDHYRKQAGGDRDFVELLTLYQKHGAEAVEMACQLAMEYKTLQLPAIIALLHDLTEQACPKEMAAEVNSYPQLQLPPEANCHRYDQLIHTTGGAA